LFIAETLEFLLFYKEEFANRIEFSYFFALFFNFTTIVTIAITQITIITANIMVAISQNASFFISHLLSYKV
jgi:hypothetical protein